MPERPQHVIFDFNGTLLDDVRVMVAVENELIAESGGTPIPFEEMRERFHRPIRAFVESVRERSFSDDEWSTYCDEWIRRYELQAPDQKLFPDTIETLERVNNEIGSVSLLSMHLHNLILETVEKRELAQYFNYFEGLDPNKDVSEGKSEHLANHLSHLSKEFGIDRNRVVLVGDSDDDGHSCRDNEIPCILVTTGMSTESVLAKVGYPVVSSLTEACKLILNK